MSSPTRLRAVVRRQSQQRVVSQGVENPVHTASFSSPLSSNYPLLPEPLPTEGESSGKSPLANRSEVAVASTSASIDGDTYSVNDSLSVHTVRRPANVDSDGLCISAPTLTSNVLTNTDLTSLSSAGEEAVSNRALSLTPVVRSEMRWETPYQIGVSTSTDCPPFTRIYEKAPAGGHEPPSKPERATLRDSTLSHFMQEVDQLERDFFLEVSHRRRKLLRELGEPASGSTGRDNNPPPATITTPSEDIQGSDPTWTEGPQIHSLNTDVDTEPEHDHT